MDATVISTSCIVEHQNCTNLTLSNVSTEVFLPKALIVYIGLKALVYQNK